MSIKSIVKYAVIIVISLALLIAAILVPKNEKAVLAGSGSGTNAEVESIEDVYDLMTIVQGNLNVLSYGVGEITDYASAPSEEAKNYTSFTYVQTSNGKASSNMSGSVAGKFSSAKASEKYERNLTAYITESASYFVCEVSNLHQSRSSVEGKTEKSRAYSSVVMHLYIAEEGAMIRFEKMERMSDGKSSLGKMDKALGKWISFSAEDGEFLAKVIHFFNFAFYDSYDLLSTLGSYMNDSENFSGAGKVYQLRKENEPHFFNSLISTHFGGSLASFNKDKDTGSFEINLSNGKVPQISMGLSGKVDEDEKILGSSISVKSSTATFDKIYFKNVNNTVIDISGIQAAMTAEEFVGLMED